MVFAFTARRDKWFVPILIAAAAIPIAFTVVAVVLGWGFLWIPVGVMLTLLAVLIVLNLRSNKAMLAQAAEQRGSSAQIVENMRGDWRVTPGARVHDTARHRPPGHREARRDPAR